MNQLTARRVYEHRQEHGPFRSRQQLLEVKGLGEATFVQAAGFLKIEGGDNPLDATWVHPENYAAAEKLLARLSVDKAELRQKSLADRIRQAASTLDKESLVHDLDIGRFALDDILESIAKPGRDPREDLPPPIFRRDIVKFEQLQPGMELHGTVLNVVDFGVFVDVGLSDSGLVHISQLSNDYVRDPHEVVAVGNHIRTWVASIDRERRRVALTMIEPGTERPPVERRPRRESEGERPAARGRRPRHGDERAKVNSGSDDRPARRRRPRRGEGGPPKQDGPRTFEKRATKTLVPITKAMEEGKEAMRSFGDLLQYVKKKEEDDKGNQD
jgi:uncharacterized protein